MKNIINGLKEEEQKEKEYKKKTSIHRNMIRKAGWHSIIIGL